MTDTPRSADAIRFAEALRRAAGYFEVELPGNENAALDTAALRALAARMEQLTNNLPPMPPGVRLTEAGMREFIEPEAAMRFAAFCAAGYTPERERNA